MTKPEDETSLQREKTQPEPTLQRGFYRCPFKCGDSRFPAPKWKTMQGAMKHIAQCTQRPEALEAKRLADDARATANAKRQAAAITGARFKIGDEIHYIDIYVLKPTHEMRRGRAVRVRYEEKRSYSARSTVIRSIGFDGSGVVYNHNIRENNIRPTLQEAEVEAAKQQASYDERCAEAAACR